jgi:hypothetical protein
METITFKVNAKKSLEYAIKMLIPHLHRQQEWWLASERSRAKYQQLKVVFYRWQP